MEYYAFNFSLDFCVAFDGRQLSREAALIPTIHTTKYEKMEKKEKTKKKNFGSSPESLKRG